MTRRNNNAKVIAREHLRSPHASVAIINTIVSSSSAEGKKKNQNQNMIGCCHFNKIEQKEN